MHPDYQKRLEALGFTRTEVNVIEFVCLRVGLITCCEHERPKFVEVFPLDAEIDSDSGLTFSEARWRKLMAEAGFKTAAVLWAEEAMGLLGNVGAA